MNVQQNTLAAAFADLVETLAAEGDTVEALKKLTRHSVTVLDVAASGVLCRDDQDRQHQRWLHAASDDDARCVQRCETVTEQGPCLDCVRTGKPVTCVDLDDLRECRPASAGEAQRRGFRSIHALPMRASGQIIGGLSLYRTDTAPLDAEDLQAAQALADVVAAGIHHQRTLHCSETRTKQPVTALHSRAILEQVKGVIASSCGHDPAEAFRLLRRRARSHQQPLKRLAAQLVAVRNASPVLPSSGTDLASNLASRSTRSLASEATTVNHEYSPVLAPVNDGDALDLRFPPGLGGRGNGTPHLDQSDRLTLESTGVGGWLYFGADRLGAFAAGMEQYAIIGLDPNGVITSWNPGAQRIKGYDAAEIIGRHFSVLYPPEKVASGEPDAALQRAAAAGSYAFEGWRVRKDGTRFWAYVVIVALRYADGTVGGFTKLTRDETQARARQERAESRFANLFGFTPVGMALFNADQVLVEANDALTTLLGYERGQLEGLHVDQLLHRHDRAEGLVCGASAAADEADVAYRLIVRADGRPVYCRLRSTLLQRDDHTTQRVVAFQPVTEHLREAEALRNQATNDYLTRLPDGRGALELLGHLLDHAQDTPPADEVPEQVGGAFQRINRTFGVSLASPMLIATAAQKVHAQHQLRQALANNELELRYQPVVATDGTVVSAEALVRWPHPDKGLLAPATILHLATEGGFQTELDRWVLRTALREAADWPTPNGQPVSIAVNLSGLSPNDHGFADTVSAIITESGIQPSRVILEMVETAIVDQLARCQRSMRALAQQGVRFAVDDFGTGHSSLARVQNLPVQIIKIDRRFIAGLGHTPVDLAVVKAIADMAHALDRECVAEGVESITQLQMLTELDVNAYQGWLFAKAMPQADFRAVLAQHHSLTPIQPTPKPTKKTRHQR